MMDDKRFLLTCLLIFSSTACQESSSKSEGMITKGNSMSAKTRVIELPDGRIEIRLPNGGYILQENQDKKLLEIELAKEIHDDIQHESLRLDGSPSGMLNSAWRRSLKIIIEEPCEQWLPVAESVGATFNALDENVTTKKYFFYASDVKTLQAVAKIHNKNVSWLLLQAWLLARKYYTDQPSVNEVL
jgi:hypothetical protein